MIEPATTRPCTRCKAVLPHESFNKRYMGKDGRAPMCKACLAMELRGNYEANKARRLPGNKAPCPKCGSPMGMQSKTCFDCRIAPSRRGKNHHSWKGGFYGRYGIDPDKYKFMFQMQAGLCAICQKPETARSPSGSGIRALAVDHNHKTDVVRALLCGYCNRGLGQFFDNPELLMHAAEYLHGHEATVAALSGAAKKE